METDYKSNFTEAAALSVVYNYAPARVYEQGAAFYSSNFDSIPEGEKEKRDHLKSVIKNMDKDAFVCMLKDAERSTISDPLSGEVFKENDTTHMAATTLFFYYDNLIAVVMKNSLLGKDRTSETIALKEDQVHEYCSRVFAMLSGQGGEGVPNIYKPFDPEKAKDGKVERLFGWYLGHSNGSGYIGYLNDIAKRIWKQSAHAGDDALSLDDYNTDDEGADTSDRNAALAADDHADSAVISTMFDDFLKKIRSREIKLSLVDADIFEHARPFLSKPREANHKAYANNLKKINLDEVREVYQKALAAGKSKEQARTEANNHAINLAYAADIKNYRKYDYQAVAKSLIEDESIPFEKGARGAGFRLGNYGFPTRYRDDCTTEEEKEQWDIAYKRLGQGVRNAMTAHTLPYIASHPEIFNIYKESLKRFFQELNAELLNEAYLEAFNSGKLTEELSRKSVEAICEATGDGETLLREASTAVLLNIFARELNEKNALHASIVDLMRESSDNEFLQKNSGLSSEQLKEAFKEIKKEYAAFIG